MEPLFLLIETSTDVCSVALSRGTAIVDSRQGQGPKVHAAQLAVFIDQLLKDNHVTLRDCAAVSVSRGPGSYTGLRVGVSTAKGLCFGAGIPLISVCSLQLLAQQYASSPQSVKGAVVVPMIDARRMEVYTAAFRIQIEQRGIYAVPLPGEWGNICAKVIDQDSFSPLLDQVPVVFTGNGAAKCSAVIMHDNAIFAPMDAHAQGMAMATYKKWSELCVEDTAYFTPFYLKEFVAGISKKVL